MRTILELGATTAKSLGMIVPIRLGNCRDTEESGTHEAWTPDRHDAPAESPLGELSARARRQHRRRRPSPVGPGHRRRGHQAPERLQISGR
jgi:hypothetical protein